MNSIINQIFKPKYLRLCHMKQLKRTFLSPAYYCKDVWESRLGNPIFQRINPDKFYFELDQRYQKSKQISAADVDVFANSLTNDLFIDELLDLVHKLRLSAQAMNILDSTQHAVVRILMENGKTEELLLTLDDRLNYGIFLDDYTANILLDHFWKNKNFVAGAMVASQIMLQEDFKHPLTILMSLLHCYNYLLKPEEWPRNPPPPEPEDEVKIRVKYLRNPYDDEHFDLKDPMRIVGKTLGMATQNKNDSLNKSFNLVGWALFGNENKFKKSFDEATKQNLEIYKEIIDLLPEDNKFKPEIQKIKSISGNIPKLLEEQIRKTIESVAKNDIAEQCEVYKKWEGQRHEALNEQKRQIEVAKRLAEVEKRKEELKSKEQKLWFFENEELIELGIEAKVEPIKKEIKAKVESDEYIPPEITRQHTP